jgi:hypothetical protein
MDEGSPPKKSLNLSKHDRSPEMVTKSYVEHVDIQVLDQIMLYYLDMNAILDLYPHDYESFETREALAILSKRFDLPKAGNFKELLDYYDGKYATVRSYQHARNGRKPSDIIKQAALAGDIQAVYNGFILYPKLRNRSVLRSVLEAAGEGGHVEIIDLLVDLGADPDQVITGLAKGGHLDIIMSGKYSSGRKTDNGRAIYYAAAYNHLDTLKYLMDATGQTSFITEAVAGAGRSGNQKIVDYMIPKIRDDRDYVDLVVGAVENNHLDIVKQYIDLAEQNYDVGDRDDFDIAFEDACNKRHFDMARLLVKSRVVSRSTFDNYYTDVQAEALSDIVAFLDTVDQTRLG